MENSEEEEEYTDASESDEDFGHDEVFESNQRSGVVEDLKKLVSSNPSITISMVRSSHPHSVPCIPPSLPASTSSIRITEVLPSLPSPVPCTLSLLQAKFPHLRLPSSHPSYLLEPVASFQPKPVLLASLTSMGISPTTSTKALFWSGNNSLERAADWCFQCEGRNMDLVLEVEVAMWLEDLQIREEETELAENEWNEFVEEMKLQRLVSADSGVYCRQQGGLMDESEETESESSFDEMDCCTQVVLVLNSKVCLPRSFIVDMAEELSGQLTEEKEEPYQEEELEEWYMQRRPVEVRQVEDMEDILLLREMAGMEDVEWAEKWVGGEGMSVRMIVGLLLWGEADKVEEMVEGTQLEGIMRLGVGAD